MASKHFFSLVVVSLYGCATTATLTFVDRSDGQEYTVKTAPVKGAEGEFSALVEGAAYTGHWIYTPNGGGYSLATGSGFSGGKSAVGLATGVNVSAQGNGLINMRSE